MAQWMEHCGLNRENSGLNSALLFRSLGKSFTWASPSLGQVLHLGKSFTWASPSLGHFFGSQNVLKTKYF